MSLPVLRTRNDLVEHLVAARGVGRRVAVVPTMGALHRGHQALIREAAQSGDEVVVSIFVNPTQFGPGEDFDRYPRTLDQDLERAFESGATAIFHPTREQMYPSGEQTRVTPGPMADVLCGASRPGHFTGVLTVVSKLMVLCSPATFVFGRKDFQQLRLIQRMVADLFLPVRVVEYPIVREADGLALSSRNAYLSPEERERALTIPRALRRAQVAFLGGQDAAAELRTLVAAELEAASLKVDYVEIVDSANLTAPADGLVHQHCLLAIAAFCGNTRLIDNLSFAVEPDSEVDR